MPPATASQDTKSEPSEDGFIVLSLNEIEALAQKAARGAGFEWGLAEEAGMALRWLAARGIDGLTALRAYLDGLTLSGTVPIAPGVDDRRFTASAGKGLCPIILGATLSDLAPKPHINRPIKTTLVASPGLILPFTAWLVEDTALSLRWDRGQVTLGLDGSIAGDVDTLMRCEAAALCIEPGQKHEEANPICPRPIPHDVLARLTDYAMRTTVPASETSRADAGAGINDTD